MTSPTQLGPWRRHIRPPFGPTSASAQSSRNFVVRTPGRLVTKPGSLVAWRLPLALSSPGSSSTRPRGELTAAGLTPGYPARLAAAADRDNRIVVVDEDGRVPGDT